MPQIDSRVEAARGERSTWFFLRRLSPALRGRRPARDDERLVPRRPRSLAKRALSDHVGALATLDLSRETRESPYSFLIGLVRYTESLYVDRDNVPRLSIAAPIVAETTLLPLI